MITTKFLTLEFTDIEIYSHHGMHYKLIAGTIEVYIRCTDLTKAPVIPPKNLVCTSLFYHFSFNNSKDIINVPISLYSNSMIFDFQQPFGKYNNHLRFNTYENIKMSILGSPNTFYLPDMLTLGDKIKIPEASISKEYIPEIHISNSNLSMQLDIIENDNFEAEFIYIIKDGIGNIILNTDSVHGFLYE